MKAARTAALHVVDALSFVIESVFQFHVVGFGDVNGFSGCVGEG
jgi:hypothetical protein